MRSRVFQYEVSVAFLVLAAGAVGMPALIWSTLPEGRSLLGFYREFYGDFARFQRHWFPSLIAVVFPLFLFEAVCTFIWYWKNHSQGMRRLLRVFGMGWLIIAFVGGQLFTWGPFGGTDALMWILTFHPRALPLIGGILVFAIVPAGTLALAIAASGSERWLKKSKMGIRILSPFTVLGTVMVAPMEDGGVGFVFLVLPFAIAHIGASLGFAASLDAREKSA